MSFTEDLRDASDWEDATRHRFVEEYRDGTLEDDAFRSYLVDDYAFLEMGARVTALAVADAPTMDEMGYLADQLGVLTGGENDYFLRAFDELGVSEDEYEKPDLRPTTEAFNDFMLRVAHQYGYEETLAVVTAAEWVYLDWCEYVEGGDYDRWYLDEWVEIHVVEEFAEYTDWLRAQLDERGPELSPRREERVAELFERTVDLEARFFDAVYD
ncbi:MAG: TenA family protein [Halobacteriales archaeon]|nr:TenA family protein [Halobacteriales archaeon]